MVASNNSAGSGLLNNFITPPGSPEVFEFNSTSGSTTSTLVPLRDQLGSTIGLVTSAGALQTQYTFDPFGNVSTTGQSSAYPFLFAGMEFDSATGLYHLQARYYSPQLQRFLSEDPKGFDGGDTNFFAYVGNSPANGTDPLGQAWWDNNGDDDDDGDQSGSSTSSDDNAWLFSGIIGLIADLFGGGGHQSIYFKDKTAHHFPACELIGAGAGRDLCENQTDSAYEEQEVVLQLVNASASGNSQSASPSEPEYTKPKPPPDNAEIRNAKPEGPSPSLCNYTNLIIGTGACAGLGIPCLGGLFGEPEDVAATPGIAASCKAAAPICAALAAAVVCCSSHAVSACSNKEFDLSNLYNDK